MDHDAGPSVAMARERSESVRVDEAVPTPDSASVGQLPSGSKQSFSGPLGLGPTANLARNPMGGSTIPTFGSWNKNPAQADGYTDVFNQVLMEKTSSSHNITRPRYPSFLSQRNLSKQSQVPMSGSTGAAESKLPNMKKEATKIPYGPHMNRDASTSQATKLTPLLFGKNKEDNECERADDSHQHHRGRSINSAGGVPFEQSPLHPMLGGRGSEKPSSFDSMQGTSGRSRHRPNAYPAPNWAQSDAGNTGYKAMDKLKERVCDIVFCKKNFAVLQTKIQLLTEEVAEVQSLLMSGQNDSKDEVQQWLVEADGVLKEANGLKGSSNMADKKRLCSTCWDPTLSWETGEMLRDIDKILEQRKGLDLSSYFCGISYYYRLESRENTLQDILEALMDIQIDVIGIHGMIGVGKTVLAKELVSRAQNNLLFDVVVMVQVSESLDVKLIQTQIANKIGLQLLEDDDEETRAHILYNKLKETVTKNEQENNTKPIQQSKILVILDGIQHVIDLMKVGITVKGTPRCKVVLLSRNADVCKEMGAEKNFSVECLNLDEAKILFEESLNDKIQSMEITLEKYQYTRSIMLMKCGGLPLMINSLACALGSMSWSNWEILSNKMLRHALLEVDEVKEVPSAILELCNNFIRKGDKQKLFLLCCLIHEQGVDVPLEKLMRYGIGFGLFEDDSLTPVVDQMNIWVHELKSLSLLLETKPQHVKIHSIIQNVGNSALCQGNDALPVLLDVGTCWPTKESYENCVAISMMSDSNYKFLNGLNLHKLQALLLKNIPSLSLPGNFLRGMPDLKILEISGTKFVELPSSIQDLKNLVTLHLEYCDIKCEIISTIRKLGKLEVFSLRGSTIRAPVEIGNLTNLRVLDITRCYFLGRFCVDAVVKMVRMRELYLSGGYCHWNTNDMEKLTSLPLEVLEVAISGRVSSNTFNFGKLRRFRMCIGVQFGDMEYISCFSRVLLIKYPSCLELVESGLREMFPWTEFLWIEEVSDLSNIGDLYADVFLHLKSMYIGRCHMKCILDASTDIFPELEILTLQNLSNLTSICAWHRRHTFFPQLRELRLKDLRQLHPYVLPAQFAVKLRVMEVSQCSSLLYIFPTELNYEIDGADLILELPYLERLELKDLEGLQALQHSSEDSIKTDERRFLFNGKIKLPSLKEMHLFRLDRVENLWDLSGSKERVAELLQSQPYGKSPCFGNLKSITVSHCYNLKSLFPSTIVNSLLQLETLIVDACYELKELITSSIDDEDDASPTTMISFPRLKVLQLDGMSRLQCFYRGRHLLKFPMLKELHLTSLGEMKAFTLPSTQSVETEGTILFDGEIDFPSLEHLEVSWMNNVELLQRHSETKIFSHLSRLTLEGLPNLKALPSIHSKTLRLLDLQYIDCCKVLFSMQPTYVHSMWLIMSLELEELRLSNFDSLEELVDDEKSVDNLFFFLKKLELRNLPQLRIIPWNMLRSLSSLMIYGLQGWTSLIPTTLLVEGAVLPLLEYITVEDCSSLEAIISREELREEDQDSVRYGITVFPSLKKIQLSWLPKLESFSKGSYEAHFPSLETVEIRRCSSLQSFSLGPLRTPRLNSVKLGFRNMEPDSFHDLNSAVAGMYEHIKAAV